MREGVAQGRSVKARWSWKRRTPRGDAGGVSCRLADAWRVGVDDAKSARMWGGWEGMSMVCFFCFFEREREDESGESKRRAYHEECGGVFDVIAHLPVRHDANLVVLRGQRRFRSLQANVLVHCTVFCFLLLQHTKNTTRVVRGELRGGGAYATNSLF